MVFEVSEVFNHSLVENVCQMIPNPWSKGVIQAIFVHQAAYVIEDCRSHVTGCIEIVAIPQFIDGMIHLTDNKQRSHKMRKLVMRQFQVIKKYAVNMALGTKQHCCNTLNL